MISHQAVLNGEVWDIKLGNFPYMLTEEGDSAAALCEWKPRQRLIRIHEEQSEDDILECFLHEMIHAQCPWLTEVFVTQMAHEMALGLIAFNYERVEE